MKKTFLTVAFSLLAAMVISCGNKNVDGIVKGDTATFDSLSYCMGIDVANSLGRDLGALKFDFEVLKKGLETAALNNGSYKVGDTEINEKSKDEILSAFFMQKFGQRMQKVRAMEKAKNDTTGTVPPVNADELDFDPETMFASDAERELISAAFGYDMGVNLSKRGYPLHLIWLFQGLDDTHNGTARMDAKQVGDYLRNYFTVVVPANNLKASEVWLAEIESQSDVRKTESGLLYKIVAAGDESVKATADTDIVRVHYKGTTRNGKVFDASRFANMPKERQEMLKQYNPDNYAADEPIEFPLNRVIKGWTEGMKLVGKGGKIMLWIHPDMAYGQRGAGNNIGPNEALCFEVELIDVNPAKTETPAAPVNAQ